MSKVLEMPTKAYSTISNESARRVKMQSDARRKQSIERELDRLNKLGRSDVLPEVWPHLQDYKKQLSDELTELKSKENGK